VGAELLRRLSAAVPPSAGHFPNSPPSEPAGCTLTAVANRAPKADASSAQENASVKSGQHQPSTILRVTSFHARHLISRPIRGHSCRQGPGEPKPEDCMAVGAVWIKLVSGCISLQTGKSTGNSPFFSPLTNSRHAANLQIGWHLWGLQRACISKQNRELNLRIRELVFPDQP